VRLSCGDPSPCFASQPQEHRLGTCSVLTPNTQRIHALGARQGKPTHERYVFPAQRSRPSGTSVCFVSLARERQWTWTSAWNMA
jgi:hypothetical protein